MIFLVQFGRARAYTYLFQIALGIIWSPIQMVQKCVVYKKVRTNAEKSVFPG